MVSCPRCGTDLSHSAKGWNYATYHVELFKCAKCDKTFKAYYKGNRLSHTIPKSKR